MTLATPKYSDPVVDLFESARRAWAAPDRLRPSEWAERYRELSPAVAAEPGPWRNDRVPYMVGIMDAVLEPGVDTLVILKGTQIAFSEILRNLIGYWIDQDPGPTLLVMPSEQSARELVKERIEPLLEDTPILRSHVSTRADDNKLGSIKLDSMSLYTAWSGSAQSLASRPIRYCAFDEVDKYPPFAGKEADPIRLGMKRIETYGHRAMSIIGSSPTVREGHIYSWYESCGERRAYRVPCPYCNKYQPLVWTQVKWPGRNEGEDKVAQADRVILGNLAWYECERCKAKIVDTQKLAMLKAGEWVGLNQWIDDHGRKHGVPIKSKRIGFHIPAIYSPWVSFSKLAFEFIQATGDPTALMDFKNARLAEPWEERSSARTVTMVRSKAKLAVSPIEVMPWMSGIYATADTQKDHFYYVIRGWGWEWQSQLLSYGIAHTFDQLYNVCLESSFKIHGSDATTSPSHLLIDSGGGRIDNETTRTDQVYEFALRDPGRILPVKGASHQMRDVYKATPRKDGTTLYLLDTAQFKDRLTRLIGDPDQSKWLPSHDVNEDYCFQMTSEHKVFVRAQKRWVWMKVSAGASNHYWDCEVYQAAAAYIDKAGTRQGISEQSKPKTNAQNPQTRISAPGFLGI